MKRAILGLLFASACTSTSVGMDGGAADTPRRDAPRDALRIDGGPCVLDEDCPGDPRFVRRCIAGTCADYGCNREDARCDDANPCTIDTCASTLQCENRTNGICCVTEAECNDGEPCTLDTCVEGSCRRAPITDCASCTADADRDGFAADWCGGPDCNDGNPFIRPDATELCTGEQDDDCDGARDLDDVDCQPPTASCEGRARLRSGVPLEASVIDARRRPSTCGSSAFFEIPLPSESDVEFALSLDPATPTAGMGFDVHGVELGVLLQTACGDPASNLLPPMPVCDRYPTAFSSSTERRFFVRRAPGGALFAEVQEGLEAGVAGGPELHFTVTATVRPAERPMCDAAPIALGAVRHFSAPDNDGLDCFGPWVGIANVRGAERIHAFTLDAPSRVVIRATPIDGSTTRVGITEGCDADAARAICEESVAACQDFAVLERILPAGTHHAVIEASAAYDVLVMAEPVGDACVGAPVLVLDAAAVAGDTTGAPDRFQYTGAPYYDRVCGGASGPDAVYQFTLDRTLEVDLEAITTFPSLLRLMSACGGDTAWAARDGSMVRRLEAGTYFVVIDGADATAFGSFTLALRTHAP